MRTKRVVMPTGKVAAVAGAMLLLGSGTAFAAGSDEAAGAVKFRDLPFTDTTDASQATANPSDPDSTCPEEPPNSTVWYRFQPKASGWVTVDTVGSNYDTVLAVWTSQPGQSARELTEVACNDDTHGLQSEVRFQAQRNQTYFIVVDTFRSRLAQHLQLNARVS